MIMILAPPILHLLLGYSASKRGGYISILLGSIVLIIFWFITPKTAFIPGVLAGWVTYGIFVILDRKK